MTVNSVRALVADIDIYLLDQILRGRIQPGMRIFDAGCGAGRNLVYFLQAGYDVRGIDRDPDAVAATRALAARLVPTLESDRFAVAALEHHTRPDASADVVIASAVLHFAANPGHFAAMLDNSWRVLAPNGLFFARLASSIGIEREVQPLGDGRFRLPDGSDRFLVDESTLMSLTARLGGALADPLKTTVVQRQRAMTTWVVRKKA